MTAGELAGWCAELRRVPPSVTCTLPGGPYRLDGLTAVEAVDRSVRLSRPGVTLYVDVATPVEIHRTA